MKTAEILLSYMDSLQEIIYIVDSYIERGLEIMRNIKRWLERIIDYVEKGIDALVESIGGRRKQVEDHLTEDYLFV